MDTIAVASPSTMGLQNIAVEPELIQILTVEQFIEKCLRFNEAHPDRHNLDIQKGTDCPVHIYAGEIGQKACMTAVAGIKTCPICGKSMCPQCGSHNNIIQLSRITGYSSSIEGWNMAKRQELLDRQRYNIGVGGSTNRSTYKRG